MDKRALAALYVQTLVSIEDDAGTLAPVTPSREEDEPIHVLTAWNPGEERPTPEENTSADSRLHSELVRRGLLPKRAIGADASSDHFEESWAVVGLNDDEARAIGAAFGQVAVFRIHGETQTVLACTESWTLSRRLSGSAG